MIQMFSQIVLLTISDQNIACLVTNIVKNSDKEKQVYSGCGVVFDGADSWNFAWLNVVIFGVDNGSSSHSDNHKNNFLILGGGLTCGIDIQFTREKVINFVNSNTKCNLSLHYI